MTTVNIRERPGDLLRLGNTCVGCVLCVRTSGGNLFKNKPRASTSEYKQPPINLRLFQNTVKFLDNQKMKKKNYPDAR